MCANFSFHLFIIFLIEVFLFQLNLYYINRHKMENGRRCDVCNIDIHRAFYAKHFRSKRHLENIRQNEIIIPEWFFKEEQSPIKKKI